MSSLTRSSSFFYGCPYSQLLFLSFCYGCRYSQHTCWSFGFWLLGHWREACLRAYGISTKLHFPKLHDSLLEKRLGKSGCALFTWLERIGSSAYWMHLDLTTRQPRVTCALWNSNRWNKFLFMANTFLIYTTCSPINLTTRQWRVTFASQTGKWNFYFWPTLFWYLTHFPQLILPPDSQGWHVQGSSNASQTGERHFYLRQAPFWYHISPI